MEFRTRRFLAGYLLVDDRLLSELLIVSGRKPYLPECLLILVLRYFVGPMQAGLPIDQEPLRTVAASDKLTRFSSDRRFCSVCLVPFALGTYFVLLLLLCVSLVRPAEPSRPVSGQFRH